jgi:hypothetical protein
VRERGGKRRKPPKACALILLSTCILYIIPVPITVSIYPVSVYARLAS